MSTTHNISTTIFQERLYSFPDRVLFLPFFSQDLYCDKKTFPSIISDSEILLMLSSTASDRLSEFEHVGHCEETLFADKPFCSRHSSERKALTSFGFVAQAYNIFSRIPCDGVNTRHFALSAMSD